MKTIEAEQIILEILAGRRGPSGEPTGHTRPRAQKEWDLAKAARACFHDAEGKRLLPHIERALFARALQRLRREGLVRLRIGVPNLIWVRLTTEGLKAAEFGLNGAGDPEAKGTVPCPRCGYYAPKNEKNCSLCGETLDSVSVHLIRDLGHLNDPDVFMANEMAWAWLRRAGIYGLVMTCCTAGLFLVGLILEGQFLIESERALVPLITMSVLLGTTAGICIVKFGGGFYNGLLCFTCAYLMESAVRVAVGGTRYELWDEAVFYYISVGFPLAMALGIIIGVGAARIVRGHGGRM